MQRLFHRVYLSEAEREPTRHSAQKFAVLDAHLEGRQWLVADRFTGADINSMERASASAANQLLASAHCQAMKWLEVFSDRLLRWKRR